MRIDWQMYDDGLLSPEEMKEAESMLKKDDGARRELEGLRSFRRMIRQAGMREPVPFSRLRRILREIVGRSASWSGRQIAVFGSVAAAVLVLALFAWQNGPLGGRSDGDVRRFASVELAVQWATPVSGLDLPTFELGEVADFEGVHCGKEWACFDYIVDGETVHVYVRVKSDKGVCTIFDRNNVLYYVSDEIEFDHEDLTIQVSGGDEAVRWQVAQAATNCLPIYR
ncbi:MAG: hypothetical protein IH944_04060 [Armatimonadetes bacterium]|nr:hypothetical protein [Armatimonadota bacterium]